jgi:predicted permease
MRGLVMTGLLRDARFALRQLRKSPGFTFTAVLMLALAICANSTVFSWIDGTMLHPIPGARDTGNLVSVMRGEWNLSPAPPLSYLDYRDMRDQNHSFSGMLAYHHDWLTLTGGAAPERIYVANVSANYFDLLGVRPALGRFFLPQEEAQEGGVPFVVLSYSLWKNRWNADPAIVGKSIEIARHSATVIGVAPDGFIGAMPGIRQDAWLPFDPIGTEHWRLTHRSAYFLNVLGRLRPGVNREQATKDLDGIMQRIVTAYPSDHLGTNTITLDPLWRSPFGANIYLSRSLPILLAIASVVLLLTCVNVATLALVRLVARRRETAIRESLGATRIQLMRQMIIEGLFISIGGGALAMLLTAWTAKRFADFIPANSNPTVLNGTIDNAVVLVIVSLSVLATLICGAFPALRSSKVNAAEVLKEETSSISSSHHRHLLSGLVVTQVALSLALLITSALFLRTLRNVSVANPGFDQDHVLIASVGVNIAGYPPDAALVIRHRILDRVSTLPGVTAAALTDWVPMSFTRKTLDTWPEGYVPRPHENLEVRHADVTAGYFQTIGMQIIAGRDFTPDDKEKALRVAIVDETVARRFWNSDNPIGRRIRIRGNSFSVVGLVKNTKHQSMSEQLEPMIYLSNFQQGDPEVIVQVRTKGDPNALAPAVVKAVQQIDHGLPVYDVHSLREATQLSSIFAVLASTFAGIFAVLALVLAATGIYGVVAYRTQLRTHEIGIRIALGATRGHVLRLILMQGIQLTVIGLLLGLALAYGLTRISAGMLYGVSATDPATAIAVVLILGAIAILACYLPAHRAMRVNPVAAIREQ